MFTSWRRPRTPLYSYQACFETTAGKGNDSQSSGRLPDMRPRGVKPRGQKGELTGRRAEELRKAEQQQRQRDYVMWAALRRDYTVAEQFVTNNFENTVVYEPFPGKCRVTRFCAATYAWTNSQPAMYLDGSDLWGKAGRSIIGAALQAHRPYLLMIASDSALWQVLRDGPTNNSQTMRSRRVADFVVKLCLRQQRQGRYYLIEGLDGKLAKIFEEIAARLLKQGGAKLVQCDLCAYGKSGEKPTRSTTSWLSNAEALLNELGRRCRCAGWAGCRRGLRQPRLTRGPFAGDRPRSRGHHEP